MRLQTPAFVKKRQLWVTSVPHRTISSTSAFGIKAASQPRLNLTISESSQLNLNSLSGQIHGIVGTKG